MALGSMKRAFETMLGQGVRLRYCGPAIDNPMQGMAALIDKLKPAAGNR